MSFETLRPLPSGFVRDPQCLGRRTEMPLYRSFFFLFYFFAKYVLVLCVGLVEIREAESLRRLQIAAAFRIFLHQLIDAPLNFRRWTLPASAEKLVVFDLQLSDVALDLAEIFVNGGHRGTPPRLLMLGPRRLSVNGPCFSRCKIYTATPGASPVLMGRRLIATPSVSMLQ